MLPPSDATGAHCRSPADSDYDLESEQVRPSELLRFALVDDGFRCSSLTVTNIYRMAAAPKMSGY
ncbi:hypothetical protein CTA1_6292 [Colletotrichum tanaceti]|uniref:Uncharacterized protein n=1 Tax=Colletotrichum tanaceti TaxID=1306861 RepID=A0A4U6X822_9PEZI|nr:hypothetical protein CTA1_6292 [Colletotrichum tanaceti]